MFELYFRPKAFRILEKIERKIQLEINVILNNLKLGKFENYNIKKIRSTKNGYRLRLRRWRILFALFRSEKKIEIVDIFLRKGKGDYSKKRKLF